MYDPAESLLARLTIPDTLTPAQYYEGVHAHDRETDAVRGLMLAVLESALGCLARADCSSPYGRRDFAEAEMWMSDRDAQGPFAFETICETLGIPPDKFRDGIRRWRVQVSNFHTPRVLRRRPVRGSALTSSR